MAYFNHAFEKAFLATGVTRQTGSEDPDALPNFTATLLNGTTATVQTYGGLLYTDGLPTYVLNQLKAAAPSTYANGYVGIFDAKTNLSIAEPSNCCNIYFAGSAIYDNDKIGPLAGGYQETNKSKMINPKYVSHAYRVDPCSPQNNVIHVGSTYWTAGGGATNGSITTPGVGYAPNSTTAVGVGTTNVTGTGTGLELAITIAAGVPTVVEVVNPGKGYVVGNTVTINSPSGTPGTLAVYTISDVTEAHPQVGCGTDADCCKEFLCGETYYLRLDVKGSPALRFLNHNAYATVDAYTGCCAPDAISPTPVDSTEVMIKWANGIVNNPIIAPFIQPVVQAENGQLLYAPGTSAAFLTANAATTWDLYVSPGHVDGKCAGLILNGAYVDTRFGDCTFQVSDFYEKEPVKLYASEVDYNGDPCLFQTLCVVTECAGLQVQGLGETVLRELVLSESYRQNFLATDLRIREITQGNQIISAIDRGALYYRYVIIHNVPRFNNPTGVFDNDQYALTFFSQNPVGNLSNVILAWLEGCGNSCAEDTFVCDTICEVPVNFPTLPLYNPYNVVSCN
jgi:hypothetical protein